MDVRAGMGALSGDRKVIGNNRKEYGERQLKIGDI